MKLYDEVAKRIVFLSDAATEKFWTEKWLESDLKEAIEKKGNSCVLSYTRKYLPKGAMILEGGCGTGVQVNALYKDGYNCIGVDFAKDVIDNVNCLGYKFTLEHGDVRNLSFPDEHFDGYWSLGVIEHFWEGYDQIAHEMFRVLKPNRYLFITFPVMSPLRVLKVFFKRYPYLKRAKMPTDFYQFALSLDLTVANFEKIGFKLVEKKFMDGFKGLKDEVYITANVMQKIYDSNWLLCKAIRYTINSLFSRICGHTVLLVFVRSR